jgi:cytoplasmic iron level regulating protein YaaA (DUF328/UPF0246 family)
VQALLNFSSFLSSETWPVLLQECSELINDLVRQARKQQRQIDWIRAKIEKAENSGFTTDSKEEILAQAKARFNGKL